MGSRAKYIHEVHSGLLLDRRRLYLYYRLGLHHRLSLLDDCRLSLAFNLTRGSWCGFQACRLLCLFLSSLLRFLLLFFLVRVVPSIVRVTVIIFTVARRFYYLFLSLRFLDLSSRCSRSESALLFGVGVIGRSLTKSG